MTSDFEALITGARAGDERSFIELFRMTQPALLRYLTAVGGALADDVASDTWVSVVRGLDRFSGDEAGWRAWVFTIAQARLRDAQRRVMRAPVTVDLTAASEDLPSAVDVAGDVETMFSTEAALALIGSLPPDQSEVVLLRYVVGLDVADTARVLDKRRGTVRVIAHRGLRRLAQLLESGPAEPGRHVAGSRHLRAVTQTDRRTV